MATRTERLNSYSTMIGPRAARLRIDVVRVQSYFVRMMLGVLVVMLLAAATHNRILQMAFIVLWALAVVILCIRLRLRHLYLKAISRSMGVRVHRWRDVPLTPNGYERWCAQNGISPYQPRD